VLQIQKRNPKMKQLVLKPNIQLYVPEFPPHYHRTDSDKIIALCNQRGYEISFDHARQVWSEHSDFWDASWLNTIDRISDDEIFDIVKQYTDVKRFKNSVIETLFDTYLQTLPEPMQDNIKASEKRGESLTAKTFEHAFLLGKQHSVIAKAEDIDFDNWEPIKDKANEKVEISIAVLYLLLYACYDAVDVDGTARLKESIESAIKFKK